MICKNCGNELNDNAKFCGKCGFTVSTDDNSTPVTPPPTVTPVTPVTTNTSGTGSVVQNILNNKSIMKIVPKILVLIGLICFFFPFMSVSCAGEKRNITGTDMIFGDKDTSEDVKEMSDDDDDNGSLFNIFVLIAGVCGVVALVKTKAGIASAVSLIIFRLSAKSYFTIGDQKLKDLEDYLKIDFGAALWIAIIVFTIAFVIDFIRAKKE